MKEYKIKKIFGPTIEGEGYWVGKPVIFIRFSGCNMWNGKPKFKKDSECPYCDTDFLGGSLMTVDEIIHRVIKISKDIKNIVISGGEPTLQLETEFDPLVIALRKLDYEISIETNGSKDFITMATIVCSPKKYPIELKYIDVLKILYPHPNPLINPDKFKNYSNLKYLQPVWDKNYKENIKKCIDYIYKNPEWRLSLQIHKIIGIE